MALPIIDKFFIIFFEKEMPVNLDEILISLLIVFSGLLEQSQTTVELVASNDLYKFIDDIVVIIKVANQLIIHPLLVFILAKALYVKFHDFFA